MSTSSLTCGLLSGGSAIPAPSTPVIAHVDGCVGPGNPGADAGIDIGPHPAARGLVRGLCVAHPCTGRALWSNNAAEYEAVLVALRVLYRIGYHGPVVIRSDSQLVVKQYNGEYGCYEPPLVELLERLRRAAGYFDSLTLEWLPRDHNSRADALARDGLEVARRRAERAAS